jgi:hypothetical protein
MGWSVPLNSKSKVDAAGRCYLDPASTSVDRDNALAIINNWRSSHSFPLNTFQMSLRRNVVKVGADPLIAQRIKRLSSIEAKLRLYPGRRLTQMQDIGGCRAVVDGVAEIDAVCDLYKTSQVRHQLVRDDDYVRAPKDSGYRGRHLIYRYSSDRKQTYNGLQVELQIRSRLQHAWATAVETVGTFTLQALKSSQGEADWLRFFVLMSSAIALEEGTSVAPATPSNRRDIRTALLPLAKRLDVKERLTAYGQALKALEQSPPSNTRRQYFLLELDVGLSTLTIREFKSSELAEAADEYLAAEREVKGLQGRDAVLVSVDSLSALRRAYPNYFADTTSFLEIVDQAVS